MKLPPVSVFEKAIGLVAPEYSKRIYRTRCSFKMIDSYAGASTTRRSLSGWDVTSGDANADTLDSLDTMRQRSRDLIRNNSLGAAAHNTKVTNIVGSGLKLQANIDNRVLGLSDDEKKEREEQIETEFALFASQCDYNRELSFGKMQDLALRAILESGDVLALSPYKKYQGDAYGLKIQFVEADRLCNENYAVDTDDLAGGVEKKDGVPYRYHVLDVHPGNKWEASQTWTKYNAFSEDGSRRNAWLLYNKIRIGQTRGVPDLAPVMEEIKQLGRYKEAELMATVVASLFTVFVKSETGNGLDLEDMTGETGGSSTDTDMKLGNGMIVDLMEGEDVKIADPGRPNPAFEAFVTASAREIGACLQIPYEVLIKHFSASYSASRAALLEAWRYFNNWRKIISELFCMPVYELFFTEAVASGRIIAPGFLSGDPLIRKAWLKSDWIGDAMGHIDEGKVVDAAHKRVEYGFSNEEIETTALTGRDWEDVYTQRKKEVERRRQDDMLHLEKPEQEVVQEVENGNTD